MKEISESTIRKVVEKIYRDVMVTRSSEYFIRLKYTHKHFKTIIDDKDLFHTVVSYLPNSNHRGAPFVLSVVFDKGISEYEIIVHNPRLKF